MGVTRVTKIDPNVPISLGGGEGGRGTDASTIQADGSQEAKLVSAVSNETFLPFLPLPLLPPDADELFPV